MQRGHRAVTGEVPFQAQTVDEIVFGRPAGETVRPDVIEPSLDRVFSDLIMRMLARYRDQRPTAREAQWAIDAWSRGQGLPDLAFAATAPASPRPAASASSPAPHVSRTPALLIGSLAAGAMILGAAASVLYAERAPAGRGAGIVETANGSESESESENDAEPVGRAALRSAAVAVPEQRGREEEDASTSTSLTTSTTAPSPEPGTGTARRVVPIRAPGSQEPAGPPIPSASPMPTVAPTSTPQPRKFRTELGD